MMQLSFILSPIALGMLMIILSPRIRFFTASADKLAPTFFLAVALHFALFANLLSTELWNKVVHANNAIRQEASGLQSMLRVAEASLADCSIQITDSVDFYKKEVVRVEFSEAMLPSEKERPFPLSKLYRLMVEDPNFIPNPIMRDIFKDALEQVRESRYERLELKDSHISWSKLLALYIFGSLTLLAINVFHCRNKSPMIFSTFLFSICFSITLCILYTLDRPYEYPYLINALPFELVK
jgi:hypothetical protein